MQVELNDIQMECVHEYAAATGISVAACLLTALDDWIRTVAYSRISNEICNVEVIRLPTTGN